MEAEALAANMVVLAQALLVRITSGLTPPLAAVL